MQILEERGYVILATNTDTVDFVRCATQLAESIKLHNPLASVCLITNETVDCNIFDHVRLLSTVDKTNPWSNDWQVFRLTPYRQTIKLEADMLICSNIEHWWTMFEHRDVVVSTGARDFYGNISNNRHYRKIFDNNNLPDVYNAITYWRLSKTAQDFFNLVKNIFENWSEYKKLLRFPDDVPSTDLVYAMAAQIIGPELVTMPFATYPKIVHMKKHINPIRSNNWTKELVWEYSRGQLRINTVAQWGAFHYHQKNWSLNDR